MQVTEVKTKQPKAVKVDMTPKPVTEPKNYKAPKVEIAEGIKAFDERPRVYTENPFSHNYIVMKKESVSVPPVKTASQMLLDPTYNTVGKFLGLDNTKEWNKYYDRVYTIVEWAKEETGLKDKNKLMSWIGDKSREVPSMSGRRVDDLYVAARLYFTREREVENVQQS